VTMIKYINFKYIIFGFKIFCQDLSLAGSDAHQ